MISNVCGCVGFVKNVTDGKEVKNVIVADYTDLGDYHWNDIEDLLQINKEARDAIEHKVSEKVAMAICARLPKNDDEIDSMIRSGYDLAKHMSWEAVVEKFVLKSLHKAAQKNHNKTVCIRA